MSKPRGAYALITALIATLAIGPMAGADVATTPAPIVPTAAPAGDAVVPGPVPNLRRADSQMAAKSGSAARESTSASFIELPGYCATGYTPGKLLDLQSFETSIPYPGDSYGFVRTTSGGATYGSWNASSNISAGYELLTYVNSSHVALPRGTRIGLAFSYLGGGTSTTGFSVNNGGGGLVPSPSWSRVALDVTAEAATNEGFLDVFFFNDTTAGSSSASTLRVDEVRVYTCVPATYKRGDWSGDGRADLMGIHGNGDLYLYPGTGGGDVSGGRRVGPGWGDFTWAGSPGDVDSNNKSDMLGVSGGGSLYLYSGVGNAGFANRREIGVGWNALTAIATPGDMTGDGSPDLLGRDASGTLQQYSFDTFGNVSKGQSVGVGFNAMSWIVGMGDLTGDRRGDLISINKADGCLYAFTTTSSGTLTSRGKFGCGWSSMTWLASPGDLNGDRLDDLIARRSDGTLWFYRGRSGGGVLGGVQVGSGWNGMKFIF